MTSLIIHQMLPIQFNEVFNAFITATPCTVHAKLAIPIRQHAAWLVYTALFNGFITAALCPVHEVGDALSTTRCIVCLYRLTSTQF